MTKDTKTILYKVRVGSHAYGMNIATSDEDFAGIFVQSIDHFFGLKAFDEQVEHSQETDTSLYSLRKYANLAVANNPNVMELMFVHDDDVIFMDDVMQELRRVRHAFLSQKCAKTYVGYASAQLHRIRSHQKWIAQELGAMEIILPAVSMGHITEEWIAWRFGENMVIRLKVALGKLPQGPKTVEMDQYLNSLKEFGIVCPTEDDEAFWVAKDRGVGKPGLVYHKHLYDMAKKSRDQYVTWMAERNPKRHEMEVKFGYDTKHGAHLVRLLRMGYEILTEGVCRVRRPDAAELLSIRQGAWTYEQITAYADEMITKINNAGDFVVPKLPDYELINSTIIRMTQEVLGR